MKTKSFISKKEPKDLTTELPPSVYIKCSKCLQSQMESACKIRNNLEKEIKM